MNAARIMLSYPDELPTEAAEKIGIIGRDIRIYPKSVAQYSAKPLDAIDTDLLILAGAVAFSDRCTLRRRASGWTRHISISIPMLEPERWRDNKVRSQLSETLYFLTGDHWDFNFRSGGRWVDAGPPSLNLSEPCRAVMPFSDGLDSFLQWKLLERETGRGHIVRVQTKSRALTASRKLKIDAARESEGVQLDIPFSLHSGNHPEPSYRTRTFKFFVLAGLAAIKTSCFRVVVGENGLGSLGPCLIPNGDEWPHRTTHPGFTARLSSLFDALYGSGPRFEHPQLFRTKAEVLADARGDGEIAWELTRSCVRDSRSGIQTSHCGVCSGCLLRRQSLHQAGLRDSLYHWDNLSGASLDDCRNSEKLPIASSNDVSITRHACHTMEALAGLDGIEPLRDRRIEKLLADMPSKTQYCDIARLIRAHVGEWQSFKRQYGTSGLIPHMLGYERV